MVDVVFSGIGGAGWQFFDDNGRILSGGRLYTYLSGTTTPAATYTSSAGGPSNGVYVQLDSAGRPQAEIWLPTNQNYKFVVKRYVSPGVYTDVRTYDDVAGLVSSVDFEVFKASFAGAAGAGLIGFSHAETYPAMTLGAKGKLTINIQDAPFNAVPGTDCTAAVAAAVAYAATFATTVGGFKSLMPTINLGPGRIIITDVNALAAPFTSGSVWSGIHLVGEGRGQTILEYSSTSSASNNYLANYENCRDVTWEDMTVKSTDSDLRCILWGPNGGGSGNGSVWTCKSVSFEGPWTEVFTVQGTALGSETTWIDVLGGAGYSGGTFFKILATNPQSVNHKFIGCTLGGLGTTFYLLAGGDISIYGGFCSLFEGGTYIYTNAVGSAIGAGNGNILIDGVNFEAAAGITNCYMVNSDSNATIRFRACNFFSLANAVGTPNFFTLGSTGNQRGGRLIFEDCHYPGKRSVFSNGVSVLYSRCVGMPEDWTTYMTVQQGSTGAHLIPNIEIDGTFIEGTAPVNPVDCYPRLLVNSFLAHNVAAIQFSGVKPKYWVGRASNDVNRVGLIYGEGDTYAGFTFYLPPNVILRRVWFYYMGGGDSTAEKKYRVTNHDASVIYIPEQTIPSPSNTLYASDPEDVFYIADSTNNRKVVVEGKIVGGSAPNTGVDYGFVVVEYL